MIERKGYAMGRRPERHRTLNGDPSIVMLSRFQSRCCIFYCRFSERMIDNVGDVSSRREGDSIAGLLLLSSSKPFLSLSKAEERELRLRDSPSCALHFRGSIVRRTSLETSQTCPPLSLITSSADPVDDCGFRSEAILTAVSNRHTQRWSRPS
jgi:hypothetical protein